MPRPLALWLVRLIWSGLPRSRVRRELLNRHLRRQYRRFAATAAPPVELFAPDVVARQAPELMGTAGTFHGHDGLHAMWAELLDAWGTVHFDAREIREFGDRDGVVVVAHARNVGLESGITTDREVGHVFWIARTGLITRVETYWDPDRAFEAVGLRRDPAPAR